MSKVILGELATYLRNFVVMALGFLFFIPLSFEAVAQETISPPNGTYVDQNGVDLLSGQTVQTTSLVSIGSGSDGLSLSVTTTGYGLYFVNRTNFSGQLNYISGRGYVVSLGDASETFLKSNDLFYPKRKLGSTLTKNGDIYTYTTSDGTVALYDASIRAMSNTNNKAHITSLTSPSGKRLNFYYIAMYQSIYLRSVTNNFGFQLKFSNIGYFPSGRITGLNDAQTYCPPASTLSECNIAAGVWPEGTINTNNLTNAEAEVQSIDLNGSTAPNGVSTGVIYSNSKVVSVTSAGGTWNYAYSDINDVRTTTITNPLGGVRTVTSRISDQLVLSDTDEEGRTIAYTYDDWQRVIKIIYPFGNMTEYTYDERGNITEVKQAPKPNSSENVLITTAGYPSSCSNPKTCNKPIWTRDAAGNQTDYTYSPVHGGLLTVTAPAPGNGQYRAQTRYTYTQMSAKLNNSGSVITAAPVWRMTSVSTCSTGNSCAGTANESIISQTYDDTRNLFANSRTVRSGNNSVSQTTSSWINEYGTYGYTDGPLPGTGDQTHFERDKVGRLITAIGPDPDGSGPLLHRAIKYNYTNGQLDNVQNGTATGPAAFSSFVALTTQNTVYDSYGRVAQIYLQSGSTISAVQQTSYDALSRPLCTATRMNPNNLAQLAVQPGINACTASTPGVFGADRITKFEYNAAGQVTKTISGFGTSVASTNQTVYYPNGNVQYLIDGNNNHTYYQYDGFGRLSRQYYPNATGGGFNLNDFQQYDYDAFGRQYRSILRDGKIIDRVFDDLGRVKQINAPGAADDISYTYNNFGQVLTAIKGADTITSQYDALGRKTSETGANGTVSYEYDAAGRGSKITYPGSGLFINYDYDNSGAVTRIRENGATSGLGVLATYEYDDLGRRIKLTRGNGVVTNTGFDEVSRLTSLENDLGGTANDQTLTFTYNPAGQIASRANDNTAYNWDGDGIASENYSVNGLNQAVQASFGIIAYDARGNMTSAGNRTYGYNIYNQLTNVNTSGGPLNFATLSYDAYGRLSQTWGTAGISKFAYSGSQMIAEFGQWNGTIIARYVYGPGTDELLVQYDGNGTSNRNWLIADVRGSIVAITDASGSVTHINKYNEYGVPAVGNVGRFQYTGQMWLKEAEVYHYKARAYDPYIGRFLQTDPIGYGDGMNMYAYVGGDPVNLRDPSGMSSDPPDEIMVRGSWTCPSGWSCLSGEDLFKFLRQLSAVRFVFDFSNFMKGSGSGGSSKACQAGSPLSHWPVPSSGALNKRDPSRRQGGGAFGVCRDNGCSRLHNGIDITAAVGSDVVAAGAGVVVFVNNPSGYGIGVEIYHSGSYVTRYHHLSRRNVSSRQRVNAGDIIGVVGRTGNVSPSADSHLHFEVVKKDKRVNPMDELGCKKP